MADNEHTSAIGVGHLFLTHWVAIFVEDDGMWGVNIWHQYAGMDLYTKDLRGRFAWIVYPSPFDILNNMQTYLSETFSDEILVEIAKILPEGATLDSRAPAYEALVPVKWQGQDAWLLWENSD